MWKLLLVLCSATVVNSDVNQRKSLSGSAGVPLSTDSNSPVSYLNLNGQPGYGQSPSAPSVVSLPNDSNQPPSYYPFNTILNNEQSPSLPSVQPNDPNSSPTYFPYNGASNYGPSPSAPSVVPIPNDSNSPVSYLPNNGAQNFNSSPSAPSVVPVPNDSNSPVSYLPNIGLLNYGPSPSSPSVQLPSDSNLPPTYFPYNNVPNYGQLYPPSAQQPKDLISPALYQENDIPVSPQGTQVYPNQEKPSNCENSEVLFKVWNIFSNLLDSGGKPVKAPDVEQIKFALTLIKKYLEEAPRNAENIDITKKLLMLETELLKDKGVILNDRRPLRSLLNFNPISTDPSQRISFQYELPTNIRPSCRDGFLNLIQTAQESYHNLARSPLCTGVGDSPAVFQDNDIILNPGTYNPSTGLLNQNPYNPVSNVQIPNSDLVSLKNLLEFLKSQGNYNSNDVLNLLGKYKPAPQVNPYYPGIQEMPNDQQVLDNINGLNPYLPQEIYSNGINPYSPQQNYANPGTANPIQAPSVIPIHTNVKNVLTPNMPIQGDFNSYLKYMKDLADRISAQNNPNKYLLNNVNPDSANTEMPVLNTNNLVTPNDATRPIVNDALNNKPDYSQLQKLMENLPKGSDYNLILKKYSITHSKLNESPQNAPLNPYYNQNYADNINKLLQETLKNIKPGTPGLYAPGGPNNNNLDGIPNFNSPDQNRNLNNLYENPNLNNLYQNPNINNLYHNPNLNKLYQNPDLNKMYQNLKLINADQNPDLNKIYQNLKLTNPDQNPNLNNLDQNPNLVNSEQNPNLNNLYQNPNMNNPYQNPNLYNLDQNSNQNIFYQNPNINIPDQNPNLNDIYKNPNLMNPDQKPNFNNLYRNPNLNNLSQYPNQNVLAYQEPIRNALTVNPNNYQLVPNKYATTNWNGVTNGAKLNTITTPKGEVELTYVLKRPQPLVYQPFYYIKYRLPYNSFVRNLGQMMARKPYLRTAKSDIYKQLIPQSNATEISPGLAHYSKEEVQNLVMRAGSLLNARFIQSNETEVKQNNAVQLNVPEMKPPVVSVPESNENQNKDTNFLDLVNKNARPQIANSEVQNEGDVRRLLALDKVKPRIERRPNIAQSDPIRNPMLDFVRDLKNRSSARAPPKKKLTSSNLLSG